MMVVTKENERLERLLKEAKTETSEFRQQVQSVETEKNTLSKELEIAHVETVTLTEHKSVLATEYQAEKVELESNICELKSTIEEMTSKFTETQTKLEVVEVEAHDRSDEYESAIQQLKGEKEGIEQELTAQIILCEKETQRSIHLENKVSEMQNEIALVYEELAQTSNKLIEEKEAFKAAIADQQTEVYKLKLNVENTAEDLEAEDNEAKQYMSQFAELEENYRELQTSHTNITQQLDEAEALLQSTEADHVKKSEQYEEQIAELKRTAEEKQEELSVTMTKFEESGQTVRELQHTIETLAAEQVIEGKAKDSALLMAEQKLTANTEEYEKQRTDMSDLETKVAELTKTVDHISAEKEALEVEIANQQTEVDQLKRYGSFFDLEAQMESYELLNEEVSVELGIRSQQLEELRNQAETDKKTISESMALSAERSAYSLGLETELEKTKEDKSSLQSSLSDAQALLIGAQAENASQQQVLDNVTEELGLSRKQCAETESLPSKQPTMSDTQDSIHHDSTKPSDGYLSQRYASDQEWWKYMRL
eukprot:Platyproteum_vivax@DN7568_c0_g1_i3.p1